MEKFNQSSILFLLLFISLTFNSCDELQTFPVNVPIIFPFAVEGNSTSSNDSSDVCIDKVKILEDNQDQIKNIRFIKAAYWTESATAGLSGDLSFTIISSDGAPILGINLPNVSVENYMSTPYKLKLTDNEVESLESFLRAFINNNECFTAKLSINNITTSQGTQYNLAGKVELVVEATVEF